MTYEDAKKGRSKRERMWVVISPAILKKFNEHVESVGYDKSRLVEKILEDYLNKLNNPTQ
jgi:hypothetical protein